MEKHLHIVCLDVPYPVNYGGVYDLFNKIRTLSDHGIKIHLHCFQYGRDQQDELNKYCTDVNYYPREHFLNSLSLNVPYIVKSRKSKSLISTLLKDNYPVLLEGIHCTYPLYKDLLSNRKVIVRLHNIEHEYYYRLSTSEKNIFKKTYFKIESALLKSYEKQICNKAGFLAVSERDGIEFKNTGAENIHYLPIFTSSKTITSIPGDTGFCLYHGKLSVAENIKAVEWIINSLKNTGIPLVIAGQDPHENLLSQAKENGNICVIANPTCKEMEDLIRKAHINILPSFNTTGVKIKLIESLFIGKHCLVNAEGITDNALKDLCYVANDATELKNQIQKLMNTPFTDTQIRKRKEQLENIYDNDKNALKLIQAIW